MRLYRSVLLPSTVRLTLIWFGFEHMANVFQSLKTCQPRARFARLIHQGIHKQSQYSVMDDSIERKDVVTSFIRRQSCTGTGWEFLLVQRSTEVSTYPYPYWGAVSGGVEPNDSDLITRAMIEIEEEVGYSQKDLEYVRKGRPLYVDDDARHFKVHPFLFTLQRSDVPIKLNWENMNAVFVSEDGLSDVEPTVPLLKETLESLSMSPEQLRRYAIVLEDREHGAAELCDIALDQLNEDISSHQTGAVAEFVRQVQNFGYHLATSRPNMSPVGNSIALVLSSWMSMNPANAQNVKEICENLKGLIRREKQRIADTNARVTYEAIAYLTSLARDKKTMSIMTLSFSSSIRDTISGLLAKNPGVTFHVFVSESRPLFEGVNLGLEFLRFQNAKVHLITEAQMNTVFIQNCIDIVLVGADSLSKTAFVNKVGTMPLVLVANHHMVDVVVVADVSKGNCMVESFVSEEKERDEVLHAWVKDGMLDVDLVDQFTTRNTYFEEIPYSLVTCVISSQGKITPEQVVKYIDDLRLAYEIAFR